MVFCCFVTVFVIFVVTLVVVAATVVVVGTFHSAHDFSFRKFCPVSLLQLHSVSQCHGTDV